MNQVSSPTSVGQGVFAKECFKADLQALGQVLLRLYEAARMSTVETFQRSCLELLSDLIPSDCGWWGRASFDGSVHRVHCSYLYHLPEDVPELLNLLRTCRIVVA